MVFEACVRPGNGDAQRLAYRIAILFPSRIMILGAINNIAGEFLPGSCELTASTTSSSSCHLLFSPKKIPDIHPLQSNKAPNQIPHKPLPRPVPVSSVSSPPYQPVRHSLICNLPSATPSNRRQPPNRTTSPSTKQASPSPLETPQKIATCNKGRFLCAKHDTRGSGVFAWGEGRARVPSPPRR